MFKIGYEIEYAGPVPRIARRKTNDVLREGFRATARTFHQQNVPVRFTERAFFFLEFAPRSVKYQAAKMKRHGHRKPLNWTGESERLSRVENIEATATRKRARAKIILASRGLNLRNPKSKIDMGKEARTISPREVPQIESNLHESVMYGFKQLENETEKTKG